MKPLSRSRSSVKRVIANVNKHVEYAGKFPVEEVEKFINATHLFNKVKLQNIDQYTINYICTPVKSTLIVGESNIIKLMKFAKKAEYTFSTGVDAKGNIIFSFTEGFNR